MNFIPINSYSNYIDANIILGRLQNDGLNCWLMDENTVTINPVWTNAIGGIKLMVAQEDAKNAMELLNKYKTDIKQKIVCPVCGSHNIELISTNRKPGNWISVFVGFLFMNFAPPIEKAYHCFDCKHEFPMPNEEQESS
jgi:DNA-directed RNA polymerase subunit RPC12/RpoP